MCSLAPAHHYALVVATHDTDVEVRIILLVGSAATVALGVGDHLCGAQVVVPAMAVQALDVVRITRVHLGHGVLDAHQGHHHPSHPADDRHVVHQLHALFEIGLITRDLEDPVGEVARLGAIGDDVATRGVGVVVVALRDRDGNGEFRVAGDVVDPLPVPEGHAAVVEARSVFFRRLQAHGVLPQRRGQSGRPDHRSFGTLALPSSRV